MSRSKHILTDCDGVLVSWNNGFHSWMMSLGYDLHRVDSYSIAQRYSLTEKRAYELIDLFNNSSEIAYLRPLAHAVHAVRELHFRHGYDFTVITSLSDNAQAHAYRRYNLSALFGPEPIGEIICLPNGAEKDSALEKYSDSGLFWIEDKFENAEAGLRHGLRPLLMNAPYNVSFETDIPRFNDWSEIYQHIILSEK